MKVLINAEEKNGQNVTTLTIKEGKLLGLRTRGDEVMLLRVTGIVDGEVKLEMTERELKELRFKAEKYDEMMRIAKGK